MKLTYNKVEVLPKLLEADAIYYVKAQNSLTYVTVITDSSSNPVNPETVQGEDGQSAYQVWKSAGNTGTEQEFLNSLVGLQGDTGDAATIQVGTIATGLAGTNVIVANSGTIEAAILDFTIPEGSPGTIGIDGDSAYAIWLAEGNVGTVENFLEAITGPVSTLAIGTTTTGAAGESADVTNSGTSSAAIFDFTIPEGTQGNGITSSSYNSATGILTLTFQDATTFSTDDLRGNTGANGQGIIAGGTTGQVLAKVSSTDYATEWVAQSGGGGSKFAAGTGVATTYVSSVVVGGTTFAQGAVEGEINSDQGYFSIDYAAGTGIVIATTSAPSTYVYVDNAGVLQQQTSTPTRQDWIRKMFTMRVAMDVSTQTIIGFEYLNNPIGHYANSIRDLYSFLLAQGIPFKKDQLVTGRSTDLGFDISAGSLLEFGGTGDIYNANIKDFAIVSNASFFLAQRTSFDAGANTNLPKFWDNAGTLTALGSTTWVGHRLYRFSNGNIVIQYGQGNYANLALARSGAVLEDFVLNPILKNAIFFGWWFIDSTATNTGNTGATVTSYFSDYTIGIQGGSSSGLSGCLLMGNNLSDVEDLAATLVNLGVTSLDAQNVKISGNQTISGEKTFTNKVNSQDELTAAGSGERALLLGTSSYETKYIQVRDGSYFAVQWGLQARNLISGGGTTLMLSSKNIAFRARSSSETFEGLTEVDLIINNTGVGIGTKSPTSKLEVSGNDSTQVLMTVRSVAGQTANMQEWANSANTVMAHIDPNGKIHASAINFSGAPTSSSGLGTGDVWNDSGTLKII
jgi:hypothetical protein